MFRLARKSLRTHLRRYVAILTAVVVSVGFLATALVLSDTLTSMFRSIIGESNAGTDVAVRSPSALDAYEGVIRPPVDLGLLEPLRRVEGVAAAEPVAFAPVRVVGADGVPIGGSGVPSVLTNWMADPAINAMNIVDGRAPSADGEVVIDAESLKRGDLHVGDTVTVLVPEPQQFEIVGTAKMANSAGSLGGATVVKAPMPTVQRVAFGAEAAEPGLAQEIDLRAEPGVSENALRQRVSEVIPSDLEAITGSEQSEEIMGELNADFLGFIRVTLLAFAGVATIAAAMTIANCFAIVATQRNSEMALLRALGASRSQVVVSSLIEASLLGLLASAIGLGVGVGFASALNALVGQGLGVPTAAPVLTPFSVAMTVLVGVGVTQIGAVVPILRMSRTSPVAALASEAAEPRGLHWRRAALGAGLLVPGLGVLGSASRFEVAVWVVGFGALATLAGMIVLMPFAVRPLVAIASVVGRGPSARFARRGLDQSPRRAAAATSALVVGIAIVSLMTVMATSVASSADSLITSGIRADLVSVADDGPLSDAMVDAMAARPEISSAGAYRMTSGEVFGAVESIGLADSALVGTALVVDGPGTTPWPQRLRSDEIVVSTKAAKAHRLRVGSTVSVRFLDETRQLKVAAIHSSAQFLGDYAISADAPIPAGAPSTIVAIVANAAPGVTPEAAAAAANEAVRPVYGTAVRTKDGYSENLGRQINNLLKIVYGMLALSVLVALVGIGTSMSLSVSERVREFRLLHAVGMNRRSLRSMVRWESALIAALGSITGIGVGVAVGAAFMSAINRAQSAGVVRVPLVPLIVISGAGVLAGVLASLRPAFRAARSAVVAPG